jgi:hypothetical protein
VVRIPNTDLAPFALCEFCKSMQTHGNGPQWPLITSLSKFRGPPKWCEVRRRVLYKSVKKCISRARAPRGRDAWVSLIHIKSDSMYGFGYVLGGFTFFGYRTYHFQFRDTSSYLHRLGMSKHQILPRKRGNTNLLQGCTVTLTGFLFSAQKQTEKFTGTDFSSKRGSIRYTQVLTILVDSRCFWHFFFTSLWSSMGHSYQRYEVRVNLVGTLSRVHGTGSRIQGTKFKIVATRA